MHINKKITRLISATSILIIVPFLFTSCSKTSNPKQSPEISASVYGQVVSGDSNSKATITVVSYNDAPLTNLSIPAANFFQTDNQWKIEGDSATLDIWSSYNGTPVDTYFTISDQVAFTKVFVGVVPPSPDKSLSAVVSGNIVAGDSNVKQTITVTSYNGASLSNLSKPTADGFVTDSDWEVSDDVATIKIWSAMGAAPLDTRFPIVGTDASTSVFVGVTPPAPAKNIAASINGNIKAGDPSVKQTITVTSYNGASLLNLTIPSSTGFATDSDWVINDDVATIKIWSPAGTNPTGKNFVINNGVGQQSSVFVGVSASVDGILTASISGDVAAGDPSVKQTITVTSYNGASLSNLTRPTADGFATDANWAVSGNAATIKIWSTTDALPVGTQFSIVGADASTSVFVGVTPPSPEKNLSAVIDGDLVAGDPNTKQTITVTSYNGASLSNLSKPTADGFATDTNWAVSGTTATIKIWSTAGSQSKSTLFSIVGTDATAYVFVSVYNSNAIPALSAIISGDVRAGDATVKQTITIKSYNGASLSNLTKPTADGFATDTNWAVSGTTATIKIWSVANAYPSPTSFTITNGDSIGTAVYVGVQPPLSYTINSSTYHSVCKIYNYATSYVSIDCINLKTISVANGNVNTFVISNDEIKNTIFIPTDFSCQLIGNDGNIISPTNSNYGIIVGNETPSLPAQDSLITISKVNVSMDVDSSYGIYFYADIAGSVTISNCTFSFAKSNYTAIYFFIIPRGELNIANNVFSINGTGAINGIVFLNSFSSSLHSVVICNNTFTITTNNTAWGIAFTNPQINGSLYISSNNFLITSPNSIDIYFNYISFNDSFVSIQDNIMKNVSTISSSGIKFASSSHETKLFITNNQIDLSVSSTGISFVDNGSCKFDAIISINKITLSSAYNDAYAFYLSGNFSISSFDISNNVSISTIATSNSYGFYSTAQYIGSLIINNNSIFSSSTQSSCSIYLNYSPSHLSINSNTLYSNSGNASGIVIASTIALNSSIDIVSNIISCRANEQSSYGIKFSAMNKCTIDIVNNIISCTSVSTDVVNAAIYFNNGLTLDSGICFDSNTIALSSPSTSCFGIHLPAFPDIDILGGRNVVFSSNTTYPNEYLGAWGSFTSNYKYITSAGTLQALNSSFTLDNIPSFFSIAAFNNANGETGPYMQSRVFKSLNNQKTSSSNLTQTQILTLFASKQFANT